MTTTAQAHPSNCPAGVVTDNSTASMPTASVGSLDLQRLCDVEDVALVNDYRALDAAMWADGLMSGLLCGLVIGALGGSAVMWLVLGGG